MTEEYVEEPASERTPAEKFWHRVWGHYWLARTIFAKRFWYEPFEDYPQTWYYMPNWKPLKLFLQWVCRVICGHEHSATEWGYGGGNCADHWCRWCNKRIKVPTSAARFLHPTFREIRPDKTMTFDEDSPK